MSRTYKLVLVLNVRFLALGNYGVIVIFSSKGDSVYFIYVHHAVYFRPLQFVLVEIITFTSPVVGQW